MTDWQPTETAPGGRMMTKPTTGSPLHVIEGSGMSTDAITGVLAEKIKDLIYEQAGDRLSLAAAMGVLDVVKFEMMLDHMTGDQ